jgi:hypothetical protein
MRVNARWAPFWKAFCNQLSTLHARTGTHNQAGIVCVCCSKMQSRRERERVGRRFANLLREQMDAHWKETMPRALSHCFIVAYRFVFASVGDAHAQKSSHKVHTKCTARPAAHSPRTYATVSSPLYAGAKLYAFYLSGSEKSSCIHKQQLLAQTLGIYFEIGMQSLYTIKC